MASAAEIHPSGCAARSAISVSSLVVNLVWRCGIRTKTARRQRTVRTQILRYRAVEAGFDNVSRPEPPRSVGAVVVAGL